MAASLAPGTVLRDRYRIAGIIGEGAMGVVYQAEDLTIPGARWALKEMEADGLDHEERQEALARFDRECRILSELNHTGLPKIIEHFARDGRHYLVMEFIEGESLETKRAHHGGAFRAEEIMPWVFQIMDILEYLHHHSPPIIYRDLKPSNIVITAGGKAKLVDFGIARAFDPDKLMDTQQIGTPGFSAPEQYGTGQTDRRSDLYSLGATIYYLLSGQDLQQFNFQFPPLTQFNRHVPPDVASAIAKALERSPENRFQSVREMREFLREKPRESPAHTASRPSGASAGGLRGYISALVDTPWKLFSCSLLLCFCAAIPMVGPFISIAGFAGFALVTLGSVITSTILIARGEPKKAMAHIGVAFVSLLFLIIPFSVLYPALRGPVRGEPDFLQAESEKHSHCA